MISFFTDPYTNELIYSAIARYHYYTGNPNFSITNEELFGDKRRQKQNGICLINSLKKLVNNLGDNYTVDEIIYEHTTFPFYKPFMSKDYADEVIKSMYKSGEKILIGNLCAKNDIYYCPTCVTEDLKKYGETYIHREHQLQGILICPHHDEILLPYKYDKYTEIQQEHIRIDEKNVFMNENRITYEDNNILLNLTKISRLAYCLFTYDLSQINKELVTECYRNNLNKKGFARYNGVIRQSKFSKEFIEFYGHEFLKLLESDIDDYNINKHNWICEVTQNSSKIRMIHPLRHLLIINFLFDSFDNFLSNLHFKYKPFGDGPWPCLNNVSDHYKKDVILNIDVRPDGIIREPVGIFKCPICGFTYTRMPGAQEKYEIRTVLDYGHFWHNKLKKYIEKTNYSRVKLAELMNCTESIIRTQRPKLYLKKSSKKNNEVEYDVKKLIDCKKVFFEAIEKNKNIGRNKLYKLITNECYYIKKYDKKWYNENIPDKEEFKSHYDGVNWAEKDIQLLRILKPKVDELNSLDTPVKVSMTLLNKEILEFSINGVSLKKMPLCKEYIDSVSDSTNSFRLKRINKYIGDKIKNNEKVTMNHVIARFRLQHVPNGELKEIEEMYYEKTNIHDDIINM